MTDDDEQDGLDFLDVALALGTMLTLLRRPDTAQQISDIGNSFSRAIRAATGDTGPLRELAVDRVRREYFEGKITATSLDIELGALPRRAWADWDAAQAPGSAGVL